MYQHYGFVKLAQVLCGIYGIVAVLYPGKIGSLGGARDSETGFIIDQNDSANTENGLLCTSADADAVCRAVVATNTLQLVFLAIARFSAYTMYPCLVLIITTKLRATTAFLFQSPFAMFMYQDLHGLHIYCGWIIFINSGFHVIFHVLRYAFQKNLQLVTNHITGITGLIALISIILISVPMMFKRCRDRIKYEFRKNVHYFFIFFLIVMALHAPSAAIPNAGFCAYIFPILLVWYILDALYCYFFMTELIETTKFHTLPSGVQISMVVSQRFASWSESGGYGYICLPWVDRTQWHAFSMFEHPDDPIERQIFMQNNGDWTKNVLNRLMQRNTHRPIWIQGPFPSPYNNAIQYDNEILVAAGIGITPALAVIRSQKENRRINLIWAVRDPEMLHFFLEHAYLSHSGWNLIFYTGKRPLVGLDEWESTNICIIKARPDISAVIPNIIYGIESGNGLPEKYSDKTAAINLLREKLEELDVQEGLSPKQKICELALFAKDSLGFIFYDLMHHLDMIGDDLKILNGTESASGILREESEDIENGQSSKHGGTMDDSSSAFYKNNESQVGTKDDFRNRLSLMKANEKVLKKLRKYKMSEDHMKIDRRALLLSDDSAKSFTSIRHRHNRLMAGNAHLGNHLPERAVSLPAGNNMRSRRRLLQSSASSRRIPQRFISEESIDESMHSSALIEQWDGLVDDMDLAFKPWIKNDEALPYVKELDKKLVLPTWGVMYCGGKNRLLESVKKLTKEVGLHLHEESFDW